MLTQICQYLRNWFERDKYIGSFIISGGVLTYADGTALPLLNGQYFRIVGSSMNDGVYCNTQAGLSTLTDETFEGAIWEMSVPRAFLDVCEEISAWRTKYETPDSANYSPFTAESFAGYSYQKGGGVSQGTGNAVTWQAQFSKQLSAWRRLNVL